MKKLVDVNNTSIHLVALEKDKIDLLKKIKDLINDKKEL